MRKCSLTKVRVSSFYPTGLYKHCPVLWMVTVPKRRTQVGEYNVSRCPILKMKTRNGNNVSKFWITTITLICISPIAYSAVIPKLNLTSKFIDDLRHKPFWKNNHNAEAFVQELVVPSYLRIFLDIYDDTEDVFLGINENCKGHIKEWIVRVNQNVTDLSTDKEKWVYNMVDAWGKIPEGIFSGHVSSFGDFHECIQIDVEDLEVFSQNKDISKSFKGRYCTTMIIDYNSLIAMISGTQDQEALALSENKFTDGGVGILESVSLRKLLEIMSGQGASMMGAIMPSIAVCMPNSCSHEEIQIFFMNALNFTINSIPKLKPENVPWPIVAFCEEEEMPGFTVGDIVVIILLSAILGISLGAGVVDYWLHDGVENPPKRGKAFQYLMAFSAYTNTKKWLSTRKSADDLGCIPGIRFFSTSWVVYAHTYAVFAMTPAWNAIDVQKIYEDWSIMPILNGTFSVDSFFVMSGMLAAYNILKMLDKTKGKFNLIMFYIHRYIRLTPTYAILVGIMATLVVYVGRGPYWMVINMQAQQCRDNWWTNILYINNLVKADKMCNGESWYLANDFQFYLLSPLMVYPIWRWRKAGLGLLIIYTILSIIAPVLVVKYSEAWPAALMTRDMATGGFTEIYQRPWSRIQTFIVGIWLGWLLHELKGKRVRIPALVACLLWLASTATVLAVIYGIQPWFDPTYEIPEVAGYFYAGLSRFSWAVVVAWTIFACVKGYGGIVNKFLSWKAFMPLGRLTFCVYLTSFHLQMIFQARVTQPMRFDKYNLVNLFFAHQVMSFLIGFLCTLFFESPFIILQKLIFEGSPKDKPHIRERKSSTETDSKKRNGIFYNDTNVITNGHKTQLNGNANSIN